MRQSLLRWSLSMLHEVASVYRSLWVDPHSLSPYEADVHLLLYEPYQASVASCEVDLVSIIFHEASPLYCAYVLEGADSLSRVAHYILTLGVADSLPRGIHITLAFEVLFRFSKCLFSLDVLITSLRCPFFEVLILFSKTFCPCGLNPWGSSTLEVLIPPSRCFWLWSFFLLETLIFFSRLSDSRTDPSLTHPFFEDLIPSSNPLLPPRP